jgi:hypothetical protein
MSISKMAVSIAILTVLVTAISFIPSFDQTASANENTQYRITTESTAVIAHYFGNDAVSNTLKQKDCKNIQLLYVKDKTGRQELMIIGTDKDQKQVTPVIAAHKPCPPYCGL